MEKVHNRRSDEDLLISFIKTMDNVPVTIKDAID